MSAELFTPPSRAFDANGNILPGSKWYFYATGTTTLQSVYADAALTTPLSNPVVADSGGKFVAIYFDSSKVYRGVLKSSDGATTIHDIDPINAGVLAALAATTGAASVGASPSGTVQDYITGQSSGPSTWAAFNNLFNYRTIAMGDGSGNFYPTSAMFGANAVSCPQTFVATIRIPATANANNHGAAIAGYAWTESPTKGAVGLFGGGVAGAASVQVWGGNTVSTNAPAINPANGTGKDGCTVYGWEYDFNLKKVGAAAANFALIGLYFAGDSEAAPAGGLAATVRCIDIDSYGINQTPRLKWNEAIFTRDGAATNAISVGTTGTGNGVGSQPIVMRSRNGSGVAGSSSLTADSNGNVVLSANSGSVVGLYHGATEMLASVPGVGTRIQSALQINGTQVLGPRATGWTAATNTASRATFDTTTVTTAQLAQRVKALIDDLITHGIIGA